MRCHAVLVAVIVPTLQLWITYTSAVLVNIRPDYHKPPSPGDGPYPLLLHEHDVTRLHDAYTQPIYVGGGTYANVTLAKLNDRMTGAGKDKYVIIKTFLNSSFNTIMKEVRIHRYVESTGVTPRLIGLLPSGPLTANISLVYEYLPFYKTISDWFRIKPGFSVNQWLNICIQLSEILKKIHSRDVMYNDLHSGNIMIQGLDDEVNARVKLIDFGFATYMYGKPYTSSYGSLDDYDYLAPEIKNHTITSKATDVYSLGNIFKKVAQTARIKKLMPLAHKCMKTQPTERPGLNSIITTLKSIMFEYWVRCFVSLDKMPLMGDLKHLKICYNLNHNYKSTGYVEQYNDVKNNQFNGDGDRQIHNIINKPHSKERDGYDDLVLEWVSRDQQTISSNCYSKLYILDKRDISKSSKIISRSENGDIRLSKLVYSNQYVVIKDFKSSDFIKIRQEACDTAILGNLGVAPKLVGLLFNRKEITKMSIVHEYFGSGYTLSDFLLNSDSYEWDMFSLLQIPHQSNNFLNDRVFHDDCKYSPRDEFKEVVNDLIPMYKMCERKSHRQFTLQTIAENLTTKLLLAAHKEGYIINNFNAHNILVKSDFATKEFDVKIIDLGHVTRSHGDALRHGYEHLSEFLYLAPEVKLGHRSSFLSDTYSLCYLVESMLGDYISPSIANWNMNMKARYEKFFSLENPCFIGWNNKNVFYSPYLQTDCKDCLSMNCSELTISSINNDSILCDYMMLEQYLFICINGPIICRPSLYTLLKLLKRINLKR